MFSGLGIYQGDTTLVELHLCRMDPTEFRMRRRRQLKNETLATMEKVGIVTTVETQTSWIKAI